MPSLDYALLVPNVKTLSFFGGSFAHFNCPHFAPPGTKPQTALKFLQLRLEPITLRFHAAIVQIPYPARYAGFLRRSHRERTITDTLHAARN